MTHDELRALLPRYAAGEVDTTQADAVRAHLASGCTACLGELFRLPVGRPRRPRGGAAVRPAAGERGLVATVIGLALALAALLAWTIYDLRQRETAREAEAAQAAARLADVDAARTRLAARIEALEREIAAVREESARHAEAARAAEDQSIAAARELSAAQERIGSLARGVQRRDTQIDRLLTGVDEQRLLRELVALPGVAVGRLTPEPAFAGAAGHLVWHPAREEAVLYVFDLPALPAGAAYRVTLEVEDGGATTGPAFKPGPRGDIALPLRLGAPAARLRGVGVVREPAGEPVLTARLGSRG